MNPLTAVEKLNLTERLSLIGLKISNPKKCGLFMDRFKKGGYVSDLVLGNIYGFIKNCYTILFYSINVAKHELELHFQIPYKFVKFVCLGL